MYTPVIHWWVLTWRATMTSRDQQALLHQESVYTTQSPFLMAVCKASNDLSCSEVDVTEKVWTAGWWNWPLESLAQHCNSSTTFQTTAWVEPIEQKMDQCYMAQCDHSATHIKKNAGIVRKWSVLQVLATPCITARTIQYKSCLLSSLKRWSTCCFKSKGQGFKPTVTNVTDWVTNLFE